MQERNLVHVIEREANVTDVGTDGGFFRGVGRSVEGPPMPVQESIPFFHMRVGYIEWRSHSSEGGLKGDERSFDGGCAGFEIFGSLGGTGAR